MNFESDFENIDDEKRKVSDCGAEKLCKKILKSSINTN